MLKVVQSFVALIVLLPLMACNAENAAEKYQAGAGKDYEILVTPVPIRDPARIEVAEAFWYGCSHCFYFEPTLAPWVASLPKDVAFVGVPVTWDDKNRILHAKMYYTAQQLNKLGSLHGQIFTAMNVKKRRFSDEGDIAKFFAENGVAPAVFAKTFNSFGVDSLVKQADAKVRGYNITGTPTLIINGKYKIMGTPEKMLDVATFLIDKERKAKK